MYATGSARHHDTSSGKRHCAALTKHLCNENAHQNGREACFGLHTSITGNGAQCNAIVQEVTLLNIGLLLLIAFAVCFCHAADHGPVSCRPTLAGQQAQSYHPARLWRHRNLAIFPHGHFQWLLQRAVRRLQRSTRPHRVLQALRQQGSGAGHIHLQPRHYRPPRTCDGRMER